MKKVGLDTCIVLRLMVGEPNDQAKRAFCFLEKSHFSGMIIYVSDMVVAESYHALCYHYKVPPVEAAKILADFLASPMVTPSGHSLTALQEYQGKGAGLVDRLIRLDLLDLAHEVVTFDKNFSKLSGVNML